MRYSNSLLGSASRALSVTGRSITRPMSYGASAETSASGGTGCSTRTPGRDRPSPPRSLTVTSTSRAVPAARDDVVEHASRASSRLIDRPHRRPRARLDLDVLAPWAVEDDKRHASETEPARQLRGNRLADGYDGISAACEEAFECQREPPPESRRVDLETAVELVGVVDEPRPKAACDQVTGRQRVEIVRVDDVGAERPRTTQQSRSD